MTIPDCPQLRRFAYEDLDQDWDLVDPDPDVIIRRHAHYEGHAVASAIIHEIDAVLAQNLSEEELEEWWIHDLRSQFEPDKIGMTYRQWFEHIADVLRTTTVNP